MIRPVDSSKLTVGPQQVHQLASKDGPNGRNNNDSACATVVHKLYWKGGGADGRQSTCRQKIFCIVYRRHAPTEEHGTVDDVELTKKPVRTSVSNRDSCLTILISSNSSNSTISLYVLVI